MKERWDLNRRAVRLLCHLDRKYFLCTLFSSLTTAIAPYIPIYFSAKIIDALTAGAGGKTLALYAALTVGLAALIGLAGALLKMHADVGEAELDRLVDWQHAEKAMDLPYALIEDRKTALLRERIEMETQTGYNVYYYAVTAGGLVRYAVQIAAAVLLGFGVMLAANEVPRIAQVFGLDTGVKVNMTSVMHTTTTAVNLTKTLTKK